MERWRVKSAHSRPHVYQLNYCHVINVKYGCFSLPLTFLLVNANRSYSDTQPHPIIAYYFFIKFRLSFKGYF